jgi:hypothetical protein
MNTQKARKIEYNGKTVTLYQAEKVSEAYKRAFPNSDTTTVPTVERINPVTGDIMRSIGVKFGNRDLKLADILNDEKNGVHPIFTMAYVLDDAKAKAILTGFCGSKQELEKEAELYKYYK